MEQTNFYNENTDAMTAFEFFAMLLKHWIFIVVTTIIITIIGGVLCYFVVKPTYTAKSTILVDCIEADSTPNSTTKAEIEQNRYAIALANEIVPTLTDLAKSDMVKNSVKLSAQENNKIETNYKSNLTVQNNEGSIVVSFVYVTSTGRDEAVATVNQIVKSLIECTNQTIVDSEGNVVSKYKSLKGYIKEGDIAESVIIKNNWSIYSIIIFAVGLIISCLIVVLINSLDDTVKDKNELESLTGYNVIAMIDDIVDDKGRVL